MSRPTVFIVSGGVGTSGLQLARTALAQFAANEVPVIVATQIRQREQIEQVIGQAGSVGGIVVHTLVNERLRRQLIELAEAHHVVAIDLIGSLLEQLALRLEEKPFGQPGLYRKMREQDIARIEAIEFAVDHDDGKRANELSGADIVLIGVSRVGKTPLSMYLSTLGWKVANVPLVKEVEPPPALFQIDPRRVIGLTVEPGQLVAYRQSRRHHLGIGANSPYALPTALVEELDFAREVFRRGRFAVVDTTDKPIEECADEILAHLHHSLKLDSTPQFRP